MKIQGRVRVLALIVKLFSTSSTVTTFVYNSNLLGLLEAEVCIVNDPLITLSVLELFYELAEVHHGMKYVLRTNILQLLISIIRISSAELMLRSRAMLISERLLSKENILMFVDESGIKAVISAIDERLSLLESQDADECECALEALAQIGSSTQGAVLLLSNASAARHVVNAAFDLHGRGKQLIRYDLEEQFRVYINTHFMMKIHTKLYLRDLMCTSQDLEGCKWKMSK